MTGATSRRRLRRWIEARAEKEAIWFYERLGGRVPEEGSADVRDAASTIDGWLRSLPAFDRGALSLWFDKRNWPEAIQVEFGNAASLVVRLECVLHPAVGRPTDELEREAVERLSAMIADRESRPQTPGRSPTPCKSGMHLTQLAYRAYRHSRHAIRGLAKARGDVPCSVPVRRTGGA
jgi:hypothetical protein